MNTKQTMSNLQLELLRLYATDIAEEDLLNIKQLLVNYFAEKITNQMDELWDERGWTNDTMREWAGGHLRTSYPKKES